jgi:hypothetical protein
MEDDSLKQDGDLNGVEARGSRYGRRGACASPGRDHRMRTLSWHRDELHSHCGFREAVVAYSATIVEKL